MKKQDTYVHQTFQPKLKKEKPPQAPHKPANLAWSKGFVKISVSYFCDGTWVKSMIPFSTLSLRKWYLTSYVLFWSEAQDFLQH
jgi:hypothetical protein